MLKNIKKGEIVIYVIALMLVAAGYLNYSSNEKNNNTVDTYSENIANIGDAVLVSNENLTIDNNNTELSENNKEQNDQNIESSNYNKNETSEENVMETSSKQTINNNDDYFIESKLERDTMYANMISSYTKVLEDEKISEAQKSVASQEITKINNLKNSIMICENILSTKGFEKCIIFINDESVNIVVGSDEELKTEQVAKIQNIISRELKSNISNIHITRK